MLNIFDSQSAGLSLIFVVIFEALAVSWGYGRYHFTRQFATLETRGKLGRVNFRKDFWDCYW